VANQFSVQVDIQDFRHVLFLAPGDRRRRQRDPDSQRLQDGQHLANLAGFLALSRSMMKRSPVPEVSAKSFCVTPNRFRLSRMIWPISCMVYLTGSP